MWGDREGDRALEDSCQSRRAVRGSLERPEDLCSHSALAYCYLEIRQTPQTLVQRAALKFEERHKCQK